MNCKPGDLAYVKSSRWGNFGRFVTVLRPCTESQAVPVGSIYICESEQWEKQSDSFIWVVEAVGQPLTTNTGGLHRVRPFADRNLRPIRPGDEQEETTTDVPQGVTA